MSRSEEYSRCPVCNSEIETPSSRDYGDKKRFECDRCGTFEVSGTALSMLPARLKNDPKRRAQLSHGIRKEIATNPGFMLTSRNLDQLLGTPLPSIPEQKRLLLELIEKELDGDELGTIPLPWDENLVGILGTLDERRVERLVQMALDEGLIEKDTKDADLIGIGAKGWELLRETRDSAANSGSTLRFDYGSPSDLTVTAAGQPTAGTAPSSSATDTSNPGAARRDQIGPTPATNGGLELEAPNDVDQSSQVGADKHSPDVEPQTVEPPKLHNERVGPHSTPEDVERIVIRTVDRILVQQRLTARAADLVDLADILLVRIDQALEADPIRSDNNPPELVEQENNEVIQQLRADLVRFRDELRSAITEPVAATEPVVTRGAKLAGTLKAFADHPIVQRPALGMAAVGVSALAALVGVPVDPMITMGLFVAGPEGARAAGDAVSSVMTGGGKS
ncbi:MAG: hypothetical protein RLO01_12260 [Thalassobaculaceae bacterium]